MYVVYSMYSVLWRLPRDRFKHMVNGFKRRVTLQMSTSYEIRYEVI